MQPYKIINLIQGSPEWHEYRRTRIGASEVAAIMGIDEWKTPLMLYDLKISGKEIPSNYAMERGKKLEPVVRKLINEKYSRNYTDPCLQSVEFPYLFASLDGWDERADVKILEIKCAKKEVHEQALMGVLPSHYFSQIQMQMFVSGEKEALYVSYHNDDIAEVIVKRDDLFLDKAKSSARAFFHSLISYIPPEPMDRDFDEINDPRTREKVKELMEVKSQIKELEQKEKSLTGEVSEANGGKNFRIGDVKVMRLTRKGNVDYTKIEALKGIDIEMYRKDSTSYWKIA